MASLVTIHLSLDRAQRASTAFPEGVKEMTRSHIRSIWKSKKANGRTWENWRSDYRGLLKEIFGVYRGLSQIDGDSPKNAPTTLYGWRKSNKRYLDALRSHL